MTESNLINSAGLVLDIVGAMMLAKFGLPPDFNPLGESALIIEKINQDEVNKGNLYRRLGRIGIALIVAGFALQLVSNFWP